MAVQAIQIQKERPEPKEKQRDALDYLLVGLDVANKGFGIASSYQNIESAKQQREISAENAVINKQKMARDEQAFNQDSEMNAIKLEEAKRVSQLPKTDYSAKEVDEMVGSGKFRVAKAGENGVERSFLLDGQKKSVLLVDTAPEIRAGVKSEKDAERNKDLYIAKLNNASRALSAENRAAVRDASYDAMTKESKIQVDKIAGSMGDVTAIRNALRGDLEQFSKAKTEKEKIVIGESMIKTLNSKMGKDAVGNQEAERLTPFLTYQKGNVFSPGAFIGRDLPAFEKQVQANLAGLDRAIELGSERISELKGTTPVRSQSPQVQQATTSAGDDRGAMDWALQNIMSADPKMRQKADEILKRPGVANLMSRNGNGFGGGSQIPISAMRGR